jgi:hypothetical protein
MDAFDVHCRADMKKALPASQGAEFGDGDSQREPVLLSAETVPGVDPTIFTLD